MLSEMHDARNGPDMLFLDRAGQCFGDAEPVVSGEAGVRRAASAEEPRQSISAPENALLFGGRDTNRSNS
jgi:hypothetical protein